MKLSTRINRTQALMRMAADPVSAARLVFSYNTRPFRRRLGWEGVAPVSARIRCAGGSFTGLFRNVSDFNVCLEVFAEGQYKMPSLPGQAVQVVLDLGSNAGFSTAFLAMTFPAARIIAVEADPLIAERSKEMLDQFANVSVVNAFVAAADGVVEIFSDPNRSISTSRFQRSENQKKISVPAISIRTLLERFGLARADVIKFDIEGAEFEVFETDKISAGAAVLIGEIHPDLAKRSLDEFRTLFPQHRFSVEPTGYHGRSVICGRRG